MAAITFAFIIGILTACLTVAYINYKLRAQKSQYERSLTISNGDLQKYRLDEAYRNGRDYERMLRDSNARALEGQIVLLQNENSKLREQLETAGIFASTLMERGSAAIHLRRVDR